MKSNIKSSLIIATYNWKEALELVLQSVMRQTVKPMEIIIADDGSKNDTKDLIKVYKEKFDMPIHHIWHEDKGFRLAEIRNKAIKIAKGDYIIQIDGDTILHKDFVKDHLKYAQRGQFISGSRVLLDEKFSKKILKNKQFNFSLFTSKAKNKHYHLRLPILTKILIKPTNNIDEVIHSIRGCNMSFWFWKEDLLAVNGYNEALTGWGREDSELSARLVNYGLKKINLKFSAIQYHIYHPENSQQNLNKNDQILIDTIAKKQTYIAQGIYKGEQKQQDKKVLLTAIIPTFNEAKNITEVIQNLSFADEILVIDSYSTDNTAQLALKENIKFMQRKFDDFSTQKNFAIQQAKNDWIFILDADERVSEELKKEIIDKIQHPNNYDGFWVPRKNFFLKKEVKYSGWQNDKVLRLFHKKKCLYNGKLVHEEIKCKGKVGYLKNHIIHYTYENYDDYVNKIKKYSSLKAKELFRKKVKPGFFYNYIKPAYRFIYHYFITFGFLDGKTGWTIAKINAIGMKERYRKLKELYEDEHKHKQAKD